MKPTRVQEVIHSVIDTRWPLFLWGPPGVGKSSVVRQIADDKKIELLERSPPFSTPPTCAEYQPLKTDKQKMVPAILSSTRSRIQGHSVL